MRTRERDRTRMGEGEDRVSGLVRDEARARMRTRMRTIRLQGLDTVLVHVRGWLGK